MRRGTILVASSTAVVRRLDSSLAAGLSSPSSMVLLISSGAEPNFRANSSALYLDHGNIQHSSCGLSSVSSPLQTSVRQTVSLNEAGAENQGSVD